MPACLAKSMCLPVLVLAMLSPAYATSMLPADANTSREPEQLELMKRGYYIEQGGALKRLGAPQQIGCRGFEIQAHRGDPRFGENGARAVLSAIASKYNGAEVDARQLRDGTWVFNHDASTGRTLNLPQGDVALTNLDLETWLTAKGRDRFGAPTNDNVYSASQILFATSKTVVPGQTINIEIKGNRGLTCGTLGTLNAMAIKEMGQSYISYSSLDGLPPLQCMRSHNPTAYLGLIQGPSQAALEKWAAANHAEELGNLRGRARLMAGARLANKAFGTYKFPRWTSNSKLSELRSSIGGDVGLHVEITDLLADPGITARAHRAGIRKVLTYTLTDNRSHIDGLKALKKMGQLPDGAIVDSTPIKTCKMLGLE
ncbi:glycerophosphodiester phosphodiesterase family protein [Pseudomonas sp. NY15435]|uniref:glycerophosphodiester phosphodiesterase family protein n=1 Tax=Pseudomonas sp. NY15435 TaxID=3400358 RepID=UPI003A884CE9